jgi:hypothetical protein
MLFPESSIEADSQLKYFLRSRYYLVSELLHRPFLCYAIHNLESSSSEVVDLAQKCLLFAFNYLTQSNRSHRHHGKWLQLQREVTASCPPSCFGWRHRYALRWHTVVENAQGHLRYWSIEASFVGSWRTLVAAVDNYFINSAAPHLLQGQDSDIFQASSWAPASQNSFDNSFD